MDIKVIITGDVYLGGGRVKKLAEEGNENAVFGNMLSQIRNADLAITNLESPIIDSGKPILKTGPAIRSSVKSLGIIQKAGFGLVTLANNHIMDFGNEGLESTIQECKKTGIATVGAGMNNAEAAKTFIFEKNNKKIAVVNIAENEFGTTPGNEPGANPLNPIANFYQIQQARDIADYVIVIVHGGHELYAYPSPRMKKTYRFFVDAGANAVIGHHPHWFSGFEVYKGAPVFYSLGNFIFDSSKDYNSNWHKGFAVILNIGDGRFDFEILPYTQNTEKAGIHSLSPLEEADFRSRIDELNAVINDDVLLESKFEDLVTKTRKMYSSYLEPHSFRLLRALQNRNILPSFFTEYKRKLLYNLIRCEAHRDIVIKNLEK